MKFYQSLFILTHSYDTIVYLSEIMYDQKLTFLNPHTADEKESFHFLVLFQHSIMEACTFLEEYDQNLYHMAEPEFSERILFIKKTLKPVLIKIHQWKDLRKVRNELIAHPWRSKNNEFSYTKIFSYNSPRTYWQLQVLIKYLSLIVNLIEAEFNLELKKVPGYMASIQPIPIPLKNDLNIFIEMNELIFHINAVCKEDKKGYYLDPDKIVGY